MLHKAKIRIKNIRLEDLKRIDLKIPFGFTTGIVILLIASIIITCAVFSVRLGKANKLAKEFYIDAGKVCTDLISEYGVCKTEPSDDENYWFISGLAYARQMDFNNDGKSELLAAYYSENSYYVEVWGYSGKEFSKLYSKKANSVSSDYIIGSWITIYHHSGKYYLGELAQEGKMNLLSLSGNKFKQSKECKYDAENDIYTVNGEINTVDFETVKLSYISDKKAEKITDIVNKNLENSILKQSNH
ncbi:MAG: hypothetical protein LIO43_00795 [Clostridiales bacterium]|nr:hypothetical protein [Clostridiales bacterium]